MGRNVVEQEVEGLKVTSQQLPFPVAQDLLPEVGEFLARALRELAAAGMSGLHDTDKVWRLVMELNPITVRELLSLLVVRTPKLLMCTTVVMKDISGVATRYELGKEQDRNAVFDEHPAAYVPILLLAGMVTFSRFFPASARPGGATPTPSS